jgi:hypothetical protein
MMLSEGEYATQLLAPLDREPCRPSTVDIRRAIADAHRHRRRARVGTVACAVAVTAVVAGAAVVAGRTGHRPDATPAATAALPSPSAPAAPTSCTMQQLPLPPGQPARSIVTGGDPSGRYILGVPFPGDRSQIVLIWDNGQVRSVPMPGEAPLLSDINTAGVAVGSTSIVAGSDQHVAWVYQNGALTQLPGGNAVALGINDRGVIVGSVGNKPAMWSSAGSPPTMLSLPGPDWTGTVNGIDEDGTMIGQIQNGQTTNLIGYLWHPDGTGEQLPVPVVNGTPVTSYMAKAIRDGWVAGRAALGDVKADGYRYTPRWNLRTDTVEVAPVPGLLADAVNGHGWIAGWQDEKAILLAGETPLALPNLGANNPHDANIGATINDDGTILAGQVTSAHGGDLVAVRWNCR